MKIKEVGRPLPKNSFLWRYFDLQKFLSLVIKKSIFFNRMDKMEDINEGISINQLLLDYGDKVERKKVQVKSESAKRQEMPLKERQKKYFLSCWLIHHRESVAMWNSYSNSDGIALKVNSHVLIKAITENGIAVKDNEKINQMFYGKIVYKDFLNPNHRVSFKDEIKIIGFQKDLSFGHEEEYRFLIKQEMFKYKGSEIGSFEILLKDFDKLKFDLIFHPKMEGWKKENFKKVLASLGVKNFNVKDSELKLKKWRDGE